MTTATYCISRSGSFEIPTQPGQFSTYYPKGQTDTILSIQPDGVLDTRPAANAGGAWETWTPSADGNRAVFLYTSECRAIPLVD